MAQFCLTNCDFDLKNCQKGASLYLPMGNSAPPDVPCAQGRHSRYGSQCTAPSRTLRLPLTRETHSAFRVNSAHPSPVVQRAPQLDPPFPQDSIPTMKLLLFVVATCLSLGCLAQVSATAQPRSHSCLYPRGVMRSRGGSGGRPAVSVARCLRRQK